MVKILVSEVVGRTIPSSNPRDEEHNIAESRRRVGQTVLIYVGCAGVQLRGLPGYSCVNADGPPPFVCYCAGGEDADIRRVAHARPCLQHRQHNDGR